MNARRERGRASRKAAIAVALLALLALVAWISADSGEHAPKIEAPVPAAGDGSKPQPKRERERVPGASTPSVRPSDPEPPAAGEPVPALAADADGALLTGEPPPYTTATRPYHYLFAISADGARNLGSLRPDHEGRFVLPEAARGVPLRLFAFVDGGVGALEHPEVVTWEEVEGKRVVFERPSTTTDVEIRCIDDAGVGMLSRLVVERRMGDDWLTILREADADTDLAGLLRTTVVGKATFRVRLLQPSTRTKRYVRPPEERFDAIGDPVQVEFVVSRPAEIIATVVDEKGQPLPKALVGLKTHEDGRLRGHPQGRFTDDEGRVHLRGIEPGKVLLQATKMGRLPVIRRAQVNSGENHQTFALVPGGQRVRWRIAGVPEGLELDRVSVHLLRVSDVAEEVIAIAFPTLGEGWSFEGRLPTGRYQATVNASGMERAIHYWFSVGNGDTDLGTIEVGRFLEKGDLQMTLRVDAEDGTKDTAPPVLLRNESWPVGVWRRERGWLGTTRRVQGLTEGTYRFRLSPQGHDPDTWDLGDSTGVTIQPGQEPPAVRLTIRRR